ncbi:hypothetical protein BCR32DRAFT_327753 [Anaeromyces robustus]|uniref:Uncharacterized protein n=1 Tax=Anaeromyces robustus TaxID=1754192 RepID=A0A1Y1X3A9_9FUNG|nr:hypothetical protein BCR32DRAFT_327752 [Anaeromyces robustus]ORX80300.1 hypothetical protein BCR32DRAFT_327753 [Anaeromyces robustus]|eukprot:ORX80299.1 hypothetical protein BCR32DRAFT_327752 [Anaeromyces robustus]
MQFKNILKVASALFLAVPSLANFSRDCDELNEKLIANVKKNLYEGENIEDFAPIQECSVTKKGKIDELYLVSKRLDEETVKDAILSNKDIVKLTYFVDDDFYQREQATYGKFPYIVSYLPKLEDLTLKYNYKLFYRGYYPLLEKSIDPACLSGKNLKTLTLDHIEINDDIIDRLSKTTIQTLNVISGDDNHGKWKHDQHYNDLKRLMKKIPNITVDGITLINYEKYTGKCQKLEKTLKNNIKKNLRNGETVDEFIPLRSCKLDKKGKITEMNLVSERNDQSTIEKVISQNSSSLTKLTYVIDDDFYQRDPAVYDDFPLNLDKLSKLEELTLKYNNEIFDHGDYFFEEREIDPSLLKNFSNGKLKVLTLDHIKFTDEIFKQITTIKSLEKLVIITGEDKPGVSHHDSIVNKFEDNNIRKDYGLKNFEEVIIDNESFSYDEN